MSKPFLVLAIAPVALLAACGSQTSTTTTTTNNSTVETTNAVVTDDNAMVAGAAETDNATAPATTGSLAAYEGKQPFDKVAGKTFTETDTVKAAIAASGANAQVRGWLANTDGPAGPIVVANGKLSMTECQAHNCGDHNWMIAIAPDGTKPEICYYDAQVSKKPSWFIDGQSVDRPPVGSAGCIQPDQ
jgi:hypothetical protein